jgi:hypothetical protein
MLISFERRFFFIHVDKAAGASIQEALRKYTPQEARDFLRRRQVWLGPLNRLAGMSGRIQFREHVTASTIRRCLPPRLYRSMFKFAFVRNPWDRLVSRYSYLLRLKEHPRHEHVTHFAGFAEYLEWEIRRGKMHQYDYLTDRHGKLIVDFFGKYENLHADFAKVCERLGLHAELARLNASPHRDYRQYYTPATRDRVAREFARDIELFGYDFDGVANAS